PHCDIRIHVPAFASRFTAIEVPRYDPGAEAAVLRSVLHDEDIVFTLAQPIFSGEHADAHPTSAQLANATDGRTRGVPYGDPRFLRDADALMLAAFRTRPRLLQQASCAWS